MNNQILYPEEVIAYRLGDDTRVTIIIKGNEEGLCNIKIEQSMLTIYPPIFIAIGELSPDIGYFPYIVNKTVPYAVNLDYIQFQTSKGTERFPVFDVINEEENTPALLRKAVKSDNQVIGYAYNSTDMNKAVEDAIFKLRKKFSKNVCSKIVESGFVTIDSSIGISYFYVIMEQQ